MRLDLNEVGQRIPPPYASEKSAGTIKSIR
jgi:hypothetical protein